MSNQKWRLRVVPMVVACPVFLQNLDTTVMATALPTMAQSLQVPVLELNLAITSYLLSLAVFLPASAWLAGRFGARAVFCGAVIVFSFGSALCGVAGTLAQLVACRMLQGIGGSMMVPVGRSILLRSVHPAEMVKAMVWFTVPGALGRLAGPLFGGAIVTVTSWRWIFLLNIPFGLLGVALALWLVEKDAPRAPGPAPAMDFAGLALLAAALLGILGGLELFGKHIVPASGIAVLIAAGVLAFCVYMRRSRVVAHPILDFGVLRFATFRMTVLGAFPLRVAVGAAPFLLPIMLQVGFGFTPVESGVLTMAMAIGALATRAAVGQVIRLLGFRLLLIVSATLAGGFYAAYGFFSPATPQPLIFLVLLLGGLCTSMTLVALNSLGYTEIPAPLTSHATAMSAMGQQLSVAGGVVFGSSLLAVSSALHGREAGHLAAADFTPVFAALAALSLASALAFRRLDSEAGAESRPAPNRRKPC